jgi:tetratricopeptide (TPR) repeat protein
LRSALDLYAQTGNCTDQVRAYFNIALVYADSGDSDAALRHLERARELRDAHELKYGDRKIEDAMDEIRRQAGKNAS